MDKLEKKIKKMDKKEKKYRFEKNKNQI